MVALVVLAAYVSLGREFMPAVSGYADFFEEQITDIIGLTVKVDSLTGSFQGFNPSIQINRLRLLVENETGQVPDDGSSALEFEQATLVVDVPRSIWQRRWVFADFLVEGLAVDAEQTETGAWQLHDINISGGADIDPAVIYQSFLQVSRLDLRNVQVNLTTRQQNSVQITNGSAVIQNRNGNHFLHIDGSLNNSVEPLKLSFEVRGNRLANITGRLHLKIPAVDYSNLLVGESFGESFGELAVQELIGGGEVWATFTDGELRGVTSRANIDQLTLLSAAADSLTLRNLAGNLQLLQGAESGSFELKLSDMSVTAGELQWAPFNANLVLKAEESIDFKADSIDLALLNRVVLNSGALSESAVTQLAAYNPQGRLINVSMHWPLSPEPGDNGSVQANLVNVDLGSLNGSPSLFGLNGYVEFQYDDNARVATGFGEVESDQFRINIPSVFVDTWDYDYVNGRLDFRADMNDGQHIKMVSSVVVAESAIVDGRVQFASSIDRYPDGRHEANLDLLVGALRVDAKTKSPYLPNAPQVAEPLKNTMQWLNAAVLGGELHNSGVIYRGSTVAGSPPETKTFQSFYVLEGGELLFSPDWPAMQDVSGVVLTNDEKIDIEVSHALSMGVEARDVTATVRRNELNESWLDITGLANGPTASGLSYLQAAPVGEGLHNAMRSWEAEGDFNTVIDVRVPLNQPGTQTDVRLNMTVADNQLTLPDYALQVAQLSGPIIFDTRTGLEESQMTGVWFEKPATIALSSDLLDGALQHINVDVSGAMTPESLIDWPLQSNFVQRLLGDMEGEFNYQARLQVPQSGGGSTSLTIKTNLEGVELNAPQPFAKQSAAQLPLQLNIVFDGADQKISGLLGADVAFHLQLEDGAFTVGLLALGEGWTDIENQIDTDVTGLAVAGQVDYLEVEPWVDYLATFSQADVPGSNIPAAGINTVALDGSIAFIDLAVDELQVYDQLLPNVGLRIESNSQTGYWDIDLHGDAVTGSVNVPFDPADYLILDLAHLHLPGGEEEQSDAVPPSTDDTEVEIAVEEIERVDPLAEIDPRSLTKMRFKADEVTIGERAFGAWRFTLDPGIEGADFNDLAFDFRGLRLGNLNAEEIDPAAPQPHFSWLYDGIGHRSALEGVLQASNMAEVLTENGIAPSLNSASAEFVTNITWPGSPAFFAGAHLSGDITIDINDGRFQQAAGSAGALKLISIINFDAIMRRLRFSDDLLRRGLAYDSIDGNLRLDDGQVSILDQLVISGPSSLYQISGNLNLADQTIDGEMYLTLPVSANIPWLGLLTANIPLAVGAYLFDRIFGDQVNNLTSAVYTLKGPWEGLQPQFKQAFGSPPAGNSTSAPQTPAPAQ